MAASNRKISEEITINIGEFLRYMFQRTWLIIMCGLTLGLGMILYSMLFATPGYESSTKIYILSSSGDDSSSLTTSDMTVSSSLTKDYTEIIQNRTVVENVISSLQLNTTYEDFLKTVDVSASSSDTRILTITITDSDPYEAKRRVDTFRDIALNQIEEVMGRDVVKVIETASYPDHRTSPSLRKNGMIGAIVGILLCILVLLVVYLRNDTIRTQSDIERYLGITVLGLIPADSKFMKKSKQSQKAGKRSRKKSKSKRA